MTNRLMLGVAISALMLSGAFAQSPTPPSSSSQLRPPTAAPANPSATAPAEKMEKQPAAKPESSAENKSDKAKTNDKAAANADNGAAAGQPKVVASQSPDQFLASNFKGTDVIGSDNKKIGDVADILFEKEGTIKAYVISFGGFLGMGAKEVAIAPDSFEVVEGKKGEAKKLKLSMSQNDLKSVQKFTEYTPPRPVATTVGAGGAGPLSAPRPSDGMAPSGK
jgi:sporulation protein YlmC with PRC-barrel domain